MRFDFQFNKSPGKVIEEVKLRVIYLPANPPSPVPEGSEEGSPPRATSLDNGVQSSSTFDPVNRLLFLDFTRILQLFGVSQFA